MSTVCCSVHFLQELWCQQVFVCCVHAGTYSRLVDTLHELLQEAEEKERMEEETDELEEVLASEEADEAAGAAETAVNSSPFGTPEQQEQQEEQREQGMGGEVSEGHEVQAQVQHGQQKQHEHHGRQEQQGQLGRQLQQQEQQQAERGAGQHEPSEEAELPQALLDAMKVSSMCWSRCALLARSTTARLCVLMSRTYKSRLLPTLEECHMVPHGAICDKSSACLLVDLKQDAHSQHTCTESGMTHAVGCARRSGLRPYGIPCVPCLGNAACC